MSYLNLLDILSNNFTVLYYTRNSDYKDEQKSKHLSSPMTLQNNVRSHGRRVRTCSAHQCGVFIEGGLRHHADMSVVVLVTLSRRPRVLPGHKDYMKYQYHRYRRRGRHRFCRCVYVHPNCNPRRLSEPRNTKLCSRVRHSGYVGCSTRYRTRH